MNWRPTWSIPQWKVAAVVLSCICLAETCRGQNAGSNEVWDQSYAVSPSLSWISTTQNQTNYGGSALVSATRSREYCDGKTQQMGIVGTASDSNTSSPGAASTLIASNDVHADYMRGVGGSSDGDHGHIGITQNYVSGFADVFMNNSLGIGLQQEYGANYQRYIKGCRSAVPKKDQPTEVFPSVTIGFGYMDQRLYSTTARVQSSILPVSSQITFIKRKSQKPPMWFASLQAGYTPALNDIRAYQAFANGTFTLPTPYKSLTVTAGELDVYLNNAPSGFKRNYQSGSLQINYSWARNSAHPDNSDFSAYSGACYTADTLNHLYCYDQVVGSECSAPGVFRLGARCSEQR